MLVKFYEYVSSDFTRKMSNRYGEQGVYRDYAEDGVGCIPHDYDSQPPEGYEFWISMCTPMVLLVEGALPASPRQSRDAMCPPRPLAKRLSSPTALFPQGRVSCLRSER